ncbi:MAG: hypothetical protein JST66_01345 [Bacteroidetes bacterium]|nr:hypothetical protein [Bacteroidota bacterium]
MHTTRVLAVLVLSVLAHEVCAQELVPNPGFEIYLKCPTGTTPYGERMTNAPGWTSATSATPDHFHRCAKRWEAKVPINFAGRQEPHAGDAYAGILLEKKSGWSEYLTCALAAPLVKDSTYEVSFWLCLSTGSKYRWTGMAGMLFTSTVPEQDAILKTPYTCIDRLPQVSASEVLQERGRWVRIQKTYTATGEERFLSIGFFCTDAGAWEKNRGTLQRPVMKRGAYYYLDDVSVLPQAPRR